MSYDNSPDVLMLMILCFAVQSKYQKILLKSIKVVYLTNGTNGSDCSHVFCIVEYLNFSRRKFTFINLCILKGSVTIKYVFKMLNTGLLRNTFILKVYWWRAFPVLTLQKCPSEPLIVLKSIQSWYFHVYKVHNLMVKCKI